MMGDELCGQGTIKVGVSEGNVFLTASLSTREK